LMPSLCADHRRWTCGNFYIGNTTQMSWSNSTLFLQMHVVAFRTFLWPSYQVSGRTWCKHVAPLTLSFHNMTEGQTQLHCRSTHSQLSQAAICSSGMWHQEMLPSILQSCHFDTISSFSIKNVVLDIFDQTSYARFSVVMAVRMMTFFFWVLQGSRWRQYVSLKHWYLPVSLHGIKTQKNNSVSLHICLIYSKLMILIINT
jgi:hypothetical protein